MVTSKTPLRSIQLRSLSTAPKKPLVSSSTFFNSKRPIPASLTRPTTRAITTQSVLSFFGRHRYLSITLRLVASTVFGLGVLLAAILGHDAFTYTERHIDRVPVNPLSLHPRIGGKKNLPILDVNLGGEEDAEKIEMGKKPRLVIVGGGWGVSVLAAGYTRGRAHFHS